MTIFQAFCLSTLVFISFSVVASESNEQRRPNQCLNDEHWVRAHHRKGYIRSDGVVYSSAFIEAHCAKNPPAYRDWYPKIREVLPNNWPLRNKEKGRKCAEEEKERIIDALSSLLALLLNLSVESISCSLKSVLKRNPASGIQSNIVLYDEAFLGSQEKLARVLSHELAHQMFFKFSENEVREYFKVGYWVCPNSGDYKNCVSTRSQFIADDGKDNVIEDFANNMEFYIFDSKKMQTNQPRIYDWIRLKYGDKLKSRAGQ